MYARSFIDSPDFARNGRRTGGEVRFSELPRLLDILENPQGILTYSVQGGADKRGAHFLDVSIAGECSLRCQRCLSGFDYVIRLQTRLLLRDQASLDALDDDAEELDSILADTHLDVLALLEEEILLSLPIAPKHEPGACRVTDGESGLGNERNPFAVLAEFKRN